MCVLLVLERRGAALEGEAGEAAAAECKGVCALCGSEFKIIGLYNRLCKPFFVAVIIRLTAQSDSRALQAYGKCDHHFYPLLS